MTACHVQQKTLLVTALVLTLAVMTESGYVDLYRHAYFENKIMRVKDVVVDVCYTFKCGQLDTSSLDDSVTSVKWHDLPEKGTYFTDKETIIRFYNDQSCKGSDNWWKIKTRARTTCTSPRISAWTISTTRFPRSRWFKQKEMLANSTLALRKKVVLSPTQRRMNKEAAEPKKKFKKGYETRNHEVLNRQDDDGYDKKHQRTPHYLLCVPTTKMTSTKLHPKVFVIVMAATTSTVLTEAGYVDLYRDAYFKHKLTRVDDVVLDACYSLTGDRLRNSITSAKWHGLPEQGSYFEGGDAVITFFTGQNCDGKEGHWYIKTQSTKDLYFPENFRLDGMNDAISSFIVLNRNGNAGKMNVCSLPESITIVNATGAEAYDSASSN